MKKGLSHVHAFHCSAQSRHLKREVQGNICLSAPLDTLFDSGLKGTTTVCAKNNAAHSRIISVTNA